MKTADHDSALLVLCSRLDRVESAIAQARVDAINVELGLKSLSQELLQGRRDQDQVANAIDKLKNGLDKFMRHVAGRLDDDEQAAEECEAAGQTEIM